MALGKGTERLDQVPKHRNKELKTFIVIYTLTKNALSILFTSYLLYHLCF